MAQFPRSFLFATPPELLASILSHLDASDLLALFLCGEISLNQRLTQPNCITDFKLTMDGRNIRFPRFAYLFPTLRSFSVTLGYFCSLYGASKTAYSKLPNTLRSLAILSDSPGLALTSTYQQLIADQTSIAQREQHLALVVADLPNTFPLLESLDLRGNAGELSEPICIFPPFLTSLNLGTANLHTTNFLNDLPSTLTRLKFDHSRLSDEDIARLPRALLSLSMGFSAQLTAEFVKKLPEGLQKLRFSSAMADARTILSGLPQKLQLLTWHARALIVGDTGSLEPIALPPTLKKLVIFQEISLSEEPLDCNLPPTLACVKILGWNLAHAISRLDSLPLLRRYVGDILTTSRTEFLQMIQPKLLHLQIRTKVKIAPDEFAVFPPQLKSLIIVSNGWDLDDDCVARLSAQCSVLEELTVDASSTTWHCVQFLPRTLVHLDSSTKMDILSPESMIDLPPKLRLLLVGRQTRFTASCVPQLPPDLEWLFATDLQICDADIALLPRSLRSLSLSQNATATAFAGGELTSAAIPALPPRLTSLSIHSRTSFHDSAVHLLPRSLVSLHLPLSHQLTADCISHLPIGLNRLALGNSRLSASYFDHQQATLSKRLPRAIHLLNSM